MIGNPDELFKKLQCLQIVAVIDTHGARRVDVAVGARSSGYDVVRLSGKDIVRVGNLSVAGIVSASDHRSDIIDPCDIGAPCIRTSSGPTVSTSAV